jgi:hypothetical protein
MTGLDTQAIAFIRSVKGALNEAQRQLEKRHLSISKVDLELQTTITTSGGGEVNIKVISLDFDRAKEAVDTITLTLVPSADSLVLMSGLADDLVAAIKTVAIASVEAATTYPPLTMTEATVCLSVGMTNEGKVSVFVTGSRSQQNVHTLTVTLTPGTTA